MRMKRLMLAALLAAIVLWAVYLIALIAIGRHYDDYESRAVLPGISVGHDDINKSKVVQILEDFDYRNTVEGRVNYRIRAKWAYQFRSGNMELRDDVIIVLHQQDGFDVEIKGNKAKYNSSRETVHMVDGVRIDRSDGWSVSAPWLRFDQNEEIIQLGDGVRITKEKIKAQGRRAAYNLKVEEIELRHDVLIEMPGKDGTEPMIIKAKRAKAFKNLGLIVLHKDVSFYRFPQELTAEHAELTFAGKDWELTHLHTDAAKTFKQATLSSPTDPSDPSKGIRKLVAYQIEVSFALPGGPIEEIATEDPKGSWLSLEPEMEGDFEGYALKGDSLRLYPHHSEGTIARVLASGDVEFWTLNPGGHKAEKKMQAQWADIVLNPETNEPEWMEMTGGFTGFEEGQQATAACMETVVPEGLTYLRGSPMLKNEQWKLEAEEIRLDRNKQQMQAFRRVTAEILGGGFSFPNETSENEKTYLYSDSMTFDEKNGNARYEGTPALLFKGTNRISGEVITVNTEKETLHAEKGVETHINTPGSASGEDGEEPGKWIVTSDELNWDNTLGHLVQKGRAKLKGKDLMVEGHKLTFVLDQNSDVEKVICEAKSVRTLFKGARGVSERFEYLMKDEIIKLLGYDKPADIIDEDGARYSGNLLTLQANSDRMSVISNDNGRAKSSTRR
ncbi:LPS export ABC transporter periplasmic protein LptC [Acidobacteriota bacterium]